MSLLIHREAFRLSWLEVVRDVWYGVPIRDLVWMRDRAPSARMCPVKLMESASVRKIYRTSYLPLQESRGTKVRMETRINQ